MKLGMFDPPEMVPYSKIDEKELDSAEHRALARALANESMVLLKNDGTLPLKQGAIKIAVVGPLADQTKYLLGNYNGDPTHTVSVLEGLKAEFPEAQITFVPGTQFLRTDGDTAPESALTTSEGKPGLTVQFSTGGGFPDKGTVLATRQVGNVDLKTEEIPQEAAGKYPLSVEWNGFLTATETGDYSIGMRGKGEFAYGHGRWQATGDAIPRAANTRRQRPDIFTLNKGRRCQSRSCIGWLRPGSAEAQLIWEKYDPRPSPEAVAAAKNADVVIAVLGITGDLEGENMPVNEEGFKGGDRTSIDLPKPEEELLEAVTAAGKPVVLVLANGSALAVNWANATRERDSRVMVPGRRRRRGNCGDSIGKE